MNPPARADAAAADDPSEGGVVVFGGYGPSSVWYFNDTWLFRGGQWIELCKVWNATPACQSSPPGLYGARMAYDDHDSELVLFGGCTYSSVSACPTSDETWVFQNGGWKNVTSTAKNATNTPPSDASDGMAYDAADGYVVLFTSGGETWEFSNDTWHQAHPAASPPSRELEAFFYDSQLASVVLWGGICCNPVTNLNDTWAFQHGNWTRLHPESSPPAGYAQGSAYDDRASYGIVFGPTQFYASTPGNATWVYSGGNWSDLTRNLSTAPPVWGTSFAYDTADGYGVLLSEVASNSVLNETWLWTDPFNVTLTGSSIVRDAGQSVSYNVTVAGGVPPYAHAISSGPTPCTTSGSGPDSVSIACANLTAGSYVFGMDETDSANRTVSVGLPLSVNPDPSIYPTAMPNPTTLGIPVAFNVSVEGGTPPFTVSWEFGDGFTSNLSRVSHQYLNSGTFHPNLSMGDGTGYVVTAALSVVVNSGLEVNLTANRSATDVGFPLQFTANSSGGTGPVTLDLSFGDGSRASTAISSHAYSTPGLFAVTLNGTDQLGFAAEAGMSVKINPTLQVESSLQPTILTSGSPVTYSATPSWGTPPYVYHWQFGDGNSSIAPQGNYVYSRVGQFEARLTVNDSVGASITSMFRINVTANSSSLPGPSSPGTLLTAAEWLLVGATASIVAIAVTAVLVIRHRRQKFRREKRD